MTNEQSSWEKELDKILNKMHGDISSHTELKLFIKSLLSSQKQRMVEELEKKKVIVEPLLRGNTNNTVERHEEVAYNKGLDTAINIIKES